jgi:hypothetical protein
MEVAMFKKELRDTLNIFFQSMTILLSIPVLLMMDWHIFHSQWELSNIFHFIFVCQVLIYAAYSGASIFQKEKRDRALEYMFSLPLSRGKILYAKIAPRLGMLLVMIAIGGILNIWDQFIADSISIILVFVLAVTISLAVDSLINAIIGVLLLNVIFYYGSLIFSFLTIKYRLFGSDVPIPWLSYLFAVLLLVIPQVVAFIKTLNKFDLKPLKWQAKSYFLIAFPSVLLMILFILGYLKQYLLWIREIN